MKKYILVLLATALTFNISAQNNSTENQIATAIVGGIIAGAAAAVAYDQYEERVELIATNYILENYPEYDNFFLSLSNLNRANDFWDPSTVKVNVFTVEIFDSGANDKKVLFMFNDYGWINEYGVDINFVDFKFMEKEEWNRIILKYLSMASGQDVKNEFYAIERITRSTKRKFENINPNSENVKPIENIKGDIVAYEVSNKENTYNLGDIEIERRKVVYRKQKNVNFMSLKSIGPDNYSISEFSTDYKVVHNENKLGLYLKANKSLVQLSINAINRITRYLNN